MKGIKLTTPMGVAKYCWLNKPDTKFETPGDFKVNLVLDKEEAEPFIEKIEKVLSDLIEEEKLRGKKKVKEAPLPYTDETDDEGNPTGNVEFKFKTKSTVKPKIPMFDSKGTPMFDVNVWAGSKIKISSLIYPYVMPIGAGISLKINAVQILDHVQGSGGTEGFGFEEEDGYVLSEEDQSSEDATDEQEVDESTDF